MVGLFLADWLENSHEQANQTHITWTDIWISFYLNSHPVISCNMLRRLPTSITLTQADITELDQLREKQANEKGSCQSERNQGELLQSSQETYFEQHIDSNTQTRLFCCGLNHIFKIKAHPVY